MLEEKEIKTPSNEWSEEEVEFVYLHANSMRLEKIAKKLHRSFDAVWDKLLEIQPRYHQGETQERRTHKWSDADCAKLDRLYIDYTPEELAKELDTTLTSVLTYARKRGIFKPKAKEA